jgi:hypothetical protein
VFEHVIAYDDVKVPIDEGQCLQIELDMMWAQRVEVTAYVLDWVAQLDESFNMHLWRNVQHPCRRQGFQYAGRTHVKPEVAVSVIASASRALVDGKI